VLSPQYWGNISVWARAGREVLKLKEMLFKLLERDMEIGKKPIAQILNGLGFLGFINEFRQGCWWAWLSEGQIDCEVLLLLISAPFFRFIEARRQRWQIHVVLFVCVGLDSGKIIFSLFFHHTEISNLCLEREKMDWQEAGKFGLSVGADDFFCCPPSKLLASG